MMTMFLKPLILCLMLVSVDMIIPPAMMNTFFGLKFSCNFPPTSCSNRCLGPDSSIQDIGSSCMCDQLCVVFGDCCPDYYTFCNIFPNNEIMLNFIKSNGWTELTEEEMNRIEVFADSSSCNKVMIGVYETYIRSIATCNKDYPDGDIKDKCEGRKRAFPLDIPLSMLSTPFMTYQNVYCAVCNYVYSSNSIKHWSANIKCHVDKAVTLRTIEDLQLYPAVRCETLLTKPDDVQVRMCDGHVDYQPCSSSLGGNKREVVDNTGPILSPSLDISEREEGSVPDSDSNAQKDKFNTSGHDIRKRNAGDNQDLNITNADGKSESKEQNITSINEFQDLDTVKQLSSNNSDNPAKHDSTSTPLPLLLKTTSLTTDSVTIIEKIQITAPIPPDPIRMPFNVEPDNITSTVSTITSTDSSHHPIIPTSQPAINIEASENVNSDDLIENNLPFLCDAYYSPYTRDGVRYKNPHCYACDHGWDFFRRTNTTSNQKEIGCQFSPSFGRVFAWPDTKVVNHYFGVDGNKFSFYSSDLGRVLDDVPSNCGIAAVYDMISQSCKNTKCRQGSVPYYETCVNTTLYSLYFNHINDSTTLYVKINGTTTGLYDKYLDLVQNVVDDLQSTDLNKQELDQSSGMVSVNRSIKLTSLELVKQDYIPEHKAESGEALTHLQLKLTVPILFNDASQTLHDLMYGNNSNYRFSIEDMIIQNYEVGTTHSCTVGISNTHTNLAMISIGRHVFVEIKGSLVDISKARFTIRKNTNNSWTVESITYCGRDYTNGNSINSVVNVPPSASLMCKNTRTLSRAMFDEIGERVMLKTGELIAPRDGEELVVCLESLLPEQSLLQNPNSQTLYKNILTIISIILKLLTFLVSICRKYSVQGGAYFYILALITSFIDVVHLLENLTNVTSPTILPIMLHFSWLFALYNSMAWCINMISSNSKRTISCCFRHLVISAVVPIATVVICATGDINDPPWDIGYGSNSHIFSVVPNVVLYGYILPASVAVVITALCHIYRIVRRKMYGKDKIFYSCNILVTGLLVVQFTFGCLEGLEDRTVFYYLYFTSSILVSWTFLAICVLIWMKKPTRLSSSLKYIETTTTKPENIYETTD